MQLKHYQYNVEHDPFRILCLSMIVIQLVVYDHVVLLKSNKGKETNFSINEKKITIIYLHRQHIYSYEIL